MLGLENFDLAPQTEDLAQIWLLGHRRRDPCLNPGLLLALLLVHVLLEAPDEIEEIGGRVQRDVSRPGVHRRDAVPVWFCDPRPTEALLTLLNR